MHSAFGVEVLLRGVDIEIRVDVHISIDVDVEMQIDVGIDVETHPFGVEHAESNEQPVACDDAQQHRERQVVPLDSLLNDFPNRNENFRPDDA